MTGPFRSDDHLDGLRAPDRVVVGIPLTGGQIPEAQVGYTGRSWDPEVLRAALEWADVERRDAPEGTEMRLMYTLIYSVFEDALRRAEA